MNDYRRRKRRNKIHTFLAILISSILILIMVLFLILLIMEMSRQKEGIFQEQTEISASAEDLTEKETAVSAQEIQTETPTEETRSLSGTRKAFSDFTEKDIYTFMQGPKAWKTRVDFSGSWCHEVLADQEFSVFGCGLCVLANIYSTLTPCDCSPLDMFHYAKEVSGYSPVSGFGAIDWPYMRQTLRTVGISSRIRHKPGNYARFQKYVRDSFCTIALVSSYDDDTYWQGVEGHYVTLWLYDGKDDTVFLSDSGNPDHNRQRIPLRYVYDALKTAGKYQYMVITDVDENGNTWQHDGISIRWKKPRYYRQMGKYE